MVTIADVAKKAGVSASTVSRVITKNIPVNEDTRLRVEKAIEETGYRPNLLAQSLRLKSGNLIGLIVPGLQSMRPSFFINSIQERAYALGYNLVLGISKGDVKVEADIIDNYLRTNIAGIILSRVSDKSRAVGILDKANVPVVVIDRAFEKENVPKVVLNNYKAGQMAAEHLVSLGHKKIGCISGDLSIPICRERLAGFQDELSRNGINMDEHSLFEGDFEFGSGRAAIKHFIENKIGITALWAQDDFMAAGAIHELYKRKIKVPEQISIIGMDDIEFSEMIYPALTTIKQPFDLIGKTAVSKIVELSKNNSENKSVGGTSNEEIISPSLIVRKSTAEYNE